MEFDNSIPWLCTFCGFGPHALKLGDLFGPYFVAEKKSGRSPNGTNAKGKRETWFHSGKNLKFELGFIELFVEYH